MSGICIAHLSKIRTKRMALGMHMTWRVSHWCWWVSLPGTVPMFNEQTSVLVFITAASTTNLNWERTTPIRIPDIPLRWTMKLLWAEVPKLPFLVILIITQQRNWKYRKVIVYVKKEGNLEKEGTYINACLLLRYFMSVEKYWFKLVMPHHLLQARVPET